MPITPNSLPTPHYSNSTQETPFTRALASTDQPLQAQGNTTTQIATQTLERANSTAATRPLTDIKGSFPSGPIAKVAQKVSEYIMQHFVTNRPIESFSQGRFKEGFNFAMHNLTFGKLGTVPTTAKSAPAGPVQLHTLHEAKYSGSDLMNADTGVQGMFNKKNNVVKRFLSGREIDDQVSFKKFKANNLDTVMQSPIPTGTTKTNNVAGFFTYSDPPKGTMKFTLNFADTNTFYGYDGPLFAQDEIQQVEMPALAGLRSKEGSKLALETESGKDLSQTALVLGAKRYGKVDAQGIYGTQFHSASEEKVTKQTTPIANPKPQNIIVMAAKNQGFANKGISHSKDDVEQHFLTAVTAFSAAKAEARDQRLEINTGAWGTGAFGNNPELMARVQILAAQVAGVDVLNYHSGTTQGVSFENAKKWVDTYTAQHPDATVQEALTAIFNDGLKAGASDGT